VEGENRGKATAVIGGSGMGQGVSGGGGAGGLAWQQGGGARPVAAREQRKRVGGAGVVHKQGRREGAVWLASGAQLQ
jgi:hypothetical protein